MKIAVYLGESVYSEKGVIDKEIGSDDENQGEMCEIGKCSCEGGWREGNQVVVKEDLQLLQF